MNNTTRNIQYVTLCFLIVFVITTREILAAQCSPDNNCTNCIDTSEKLKCKFDRMAIEGKKTMELLEGVPGLLSPAQTHGIGKAKERMDRERGRLKPDDFKILSKKRSVNCQLVESSEVGAIHNDDGICDPKNEDCAEVIGDGIGDDDGICSPMNGRKREVCVQICDEEAILVDESAMDENSAAELEGMYDTLTQHIEEVGETIPETTALIQRLAYISNSDPCVLQTTLQRHSYDTYQKARWAAVGSRTAADVAERFCDQVTGGFFAFSVGAACVAGESIAMAMNVWWETINNIESELDALTLDATIACAAQAASEGKQTGAMIQTVQATLNDVRTNNAEILRLIKIPPGQRDDYPTP